MGGPAGPCLAAGTEHGWVEQPHGLMVIVDDCSESTTRLFDTMSARMKLVSGEVTGSALTMKLAELCPAAVAVRLWPGVRNLSGEPTSGQGLVVVGEERG